MKKNLCGLNTAAHLACALSIIPLAPLYSQDVGEESWPGSASSRVSSALRTDPHRSATSADGLLPYGKPEATTVRKGSPFLEDGPDTRLFVGCGAEVLAPGINIEVEDLPAVRYDRTLTKAEIRALDADASGEARQTVGLTLVLAGVVEAKTLPAQDPDGAHSCVLVSELRILPMKDVTVYLPRDYPQGSCNYNVVKRHEDKHVAIARRLVSEFKPRFQDAVRRLRMPADAISSGHDLDARSADKTGASVRAAVQAVIDELEGEMRSQNRLLDAADTERSLRECPFW